MMKLTEAAVVLAVLLGVANGQLFDDLYNDLTGRGAKNTIPVSSKGVPLNITIGMHLIRINSLDTTTGDVDLRAWMLYAWRDSRLTWSPDNFDNITTIHLPSSEVWNHDIVMYLGDTEEKSTNFVVTNTGHLFRIPATNIKTRCDVSAYSTNNTVVCTFKFGSWTYSGNVVNLRTQNHQQGIDVGDYSPLPGDWEVEDTNVQRNVVYYMCCQHPYIDVVFRLTLTRSG